MSAQKRSLEPDAAIVVLGGSFCPVHAGHLAALEAGRAQAQALGLTVVAGYLACAHDGMYVMHVEDACSSSAFPAKHKSHTSQGDACAS